MPPRLQRLVIASNNAGKLAEFQAMLAPLGLAVAPQGAFGVPETEEPHVTFIENALEKARHASRHTGLAALADDSGICVPALGNAPGVYSARYAGEPKSDQRNNERLLAELSSPNGRLLPRDAYYYCVLVLVRHADDPRPLIAEGIWRGQIAEQPRGHSGFGYDPLFWLPGLSKTAAELAADEKNRLSHRGQALRALIQRLRDDI